MKFSFNQLSVSTAVFLAACGLFFMGGVKPAYADPHAVFYTVSGQQQLFFNMLAALDQADYVETAKQTIGQPSNSSRSELLKNRSDAGFPAETDTRLVATTTSLNNILTRGVTLEGQDLWTAYLAEQFSIEATRRRNTDELVRIYCQKGLGREGCENSIDNTTKVLEDEDKAFVRDPIKFAANSIFRGPFSALLSGLPGQQKEAADTILNSSSDSEPTLPLAYDAAVAQWWKAALKGNDSNKTNAASNAVLSVASSFFRPIVNSSIWDYVSFGSDGSANLKSRAALVSEGLLPASERNTAYAQSAGQGAIDPDTYEGHEALLAMALTNAAGLHASAESAETRYDEQIKDTLVDGAVPDISLDNSGGTGGDLYGELSAIVNTPAHAKVAATQASIDSVSNTEQNTQYAAVASEHQPGTTQTVERGDGSGGAVQGISSDSGQLGTPSSTTAISAEGSVLGIISQPTGQDPDHHTTQPALPLNADLTAFHHEQGPAHLLKAIGYGSDRGGCGCSAHTATNHFGAQIIARINGH